MIKKTRKIQECLEMNWISRLFSITILLLMTGNLLANVNYGEALQKSIYFYEAQQSGNLPSWNRVQWRGNATMDDGSDVGLDLSGGWYDAGDHVKFGFPMAASATMLAWGVIEYPQAYEQTNQLKHIKNNLRFIADYFVQAHPSPNVFYGQVGKGNDDHSWWGPVEVIEKTPRKASDRPSFKIDEQCPGSDIAGETAAALAAISMVFKQDDPSYSAMLLNHSKQLFKFADEFRGDYSDCITDVKNFYNSWSGHIDELVWSASWIYRATMERSYLEKAEAIYEDLNLEAQSSYRSYKWTQNWDDKSYGSYVMLSKLTGKNKYRIDAERWLDYWTIGFEGSRVPYTNGGLARLDTWGVNRYAANTSFLALVYSDFLKSRDSNSNRASIYYDFAVNQMEYIMGDNPMGITYQIGMGEKSPQNPHHRTAHGSWSDSLQTPEINRHQLVGALVGGPASGDVYKDDRGDYIANEVACDYNASFTSALARLYLDFGGNPIPESDFPEPEEKSLEFFTETKVNSSGPRYVELSTILYNQSAWPARSSSNLKFRYWIDLTQEFAHGYQLKDIAVSTAYNQGTGVSELKPWPSKDRDLYFIEVSFEGVDIFPGGQSEHKKEVQYRISLPSNSNLPHWDNANDPSWSEDYRGNRVKSPKVTIYDGTKLVWGSEPSMY